MTEIREKLASPLISEMFDLEPLSSTETRCNGWLDKRTNLTFQLGPEFFQRPTDSNWRFFMHNSNGASPLLVAAFTIERTIPGISPVQAAIYDVSERDILHYVTPGRYFSPEKIERRINEFEPRYRERVLKMASDIRRSKLLESQRIEMMMKLGGQKSLLSIVVAGIRACHVRWRVTPEGGKPLRNWAETVEVRISKVS